MLIGDGPERENLHDLARHLGIADRVFFIGKVPYTEIPRYLAFADAFVTASVTEVHPLTVIEAMAAGLPVLGIQSPGVGDTVEDGATGLIVESEDIAVFTAKMVRLVANAEERRRMGAQARQASEQYRIQTTSQMMQERYQHLIEQAASRPPGARERLSAKLKGLAK
jgi:glycosyltransferase involved in cell wall biosynthesis